MSIVVNGSGTITGISTGGLPDGSVDAGTLATNAVTAAKLATDSVTASKIATNSVDSAELIDGAVDDSHIAALASSKLTGALPAISGANLTGITTGKVIQMNSKASAATTFNNASGTVTLDTLAFSNAHTSGNGVFIGYPIQTYTTSASTGDAWLYFKVFNGSTELDSQGRYYWASGAVGYNNMYACCVFPSISSTATLTVKITAATNSSYQQVINGQDNAKAFFIQEIA